jgi:hypothetical protein
MSSARSGDDQLWDGPARLVANAVAIYAAADNLIEPGQWKVTANGVANGVATPPQARCLTLEQVADVATTFGPVSGTVNSTCERTEYEATGRSLKWRLPSAGRQVR